MPGRIDQIESVVLPVLSLVNHRYRVALNRDATLTLQIHRVEQLVLHFAHLDGAGQFKDAVRQRRLAVVDVRDDAEVAGMVQIGH